MADEFKRVSIHFVGRLRQVQTALHSSLSMGVVERGCRERQLRDALQADYDDALTEQKRHFTLVFVLLFSSQHGHFPRFTDSWLRLPAPAPAELSLDPLDTLVNMLTTLFAAGLIEDRALIDAVTFSVLPSRFEFFVTEFGIENFIRVLDGVRDSPLYYDLARVAFVAPSFLRFVRAVFPGILSSGLIDRPTLGRLVSQIKDGWQANLDLLPAVVPRLLLRSPDAKLTLSRAFFEVALGAQTATVYGLIDFNQRLPDWLVAALRQLLTVGPWTILDDLVYMATNTAKQVAPVLTLAHRENVPSLFERMLLSDVDVSACSSLHMDGTFCAPQEYSLKLVRVPVETRGSSLVDSPEGASTLAVADGHLRHLLQSADPLPLFNKVPRRLDLGRFLDEFLVKRGPRDSLTGRRDAAEALRVMVRPFAEASVQAIAKRVSVDRKRELRILTLIQDMIQFVKQIKDDSEDIRDNTEKAFYYQFLREFWPQQKRPPLAEVFQQPQLLGESFRAITAALARDSKIRFAQELAYGFLTADFNFTAFKAARPELTRLDVRVAQKLAAPEAVIEVDFPTSLRTESPGKFNKVAWMVAQLDKLKQREDLLDIVRNACYESSPIRKVGEFQRALTEATTFFAKDFPPSIDMGADEFTPIMISYLAIANPVDFVSNLIFLVEFCGQAALAGMFEDQILHPIMTLHAVCMRVLPDVDLKTLTRCQCDCL
jgi:hypothetical protein